MLLTKPFATLVTTFAALGLFISAPHPAPGNEASAVLVSGLRVQAGPEDLAVPEIDPAAKPVLEQMESAYNELNSANIAGTVALQVDLPKTSRKSTQTFNSSFERPNKFRHQLKNILLSCDGAQGYAFDQNERAYLKFQLPREKQHLGDLPEVVPNILQTQNPSLLFALTQSPFSDLAQNFQKVTKLPDRKIDGVSYSVLQFGSEAMPHKIELYVDPKTHLVRRFILDFTAALKESAGEEVNRATLSVDYTTITANPTLDGQQFAWTPPADALDVKEAAGAENRQDQQEQEQQEQESQP